MNSLILFDGFSIFFICLLVHISHWRLKKPQNDLVALFFTFLFVPAVIIFLMPAIFSKVKLIFFSDFSLIERTAIYLLHFALSGIYISSYPAAQASSPSLQILLMYRRSLTGRLTKQDILRAFDNLHIVEDRVKDLVNTKLVKQKNERFFLTFWGYLIVIVTILYRRGLGLDLKGG